MLGSVLYHFAIGHHNASDLFLPTLPPLIPNIFPFLIEQIEVGFYKEKNCIVAIDSLF